jgi:molybdate transport system substrate-binding protein
MKINQATKTNFLQSPRLALAGVVSASLLLLANAAPHKQIQVMTSGAFTEPLTKLVPDFEKKTSIDVATVFGPSMGNTPEAIPNRIQRGEPVDLVIMADTALDSLIKSGKIVPGSRVDLVRSDIGMVVRAGAPKPDISSVDALKRTLLNAKSIAYSDSASGVYISTQMFQHLGIADQVTSKSKKIEGERVAAVVARGEAEIGFQQISELLPVPGADFVGPLPDEVQKVTVFSAGIAVGAKHADAARALIRYLTSPAATQEITKSGLEQIAPHKAGAKPEKKAAAAIEPMAPSLTYATQIFESVRALSSGLPVRLRSSSDVTPFKFRMITA